MMESAQSMSSWVRGWIASPPRAGSLTVSYCSSISACVAKTTPALALAAIFSLQSSESCAYSMVEVRAASAASRASPAALVALDAASLALPAAVAAAVAAESAAVA